MIRAVLFSPAAAVRLPGAAQFGQVPDDHAPRLVPGRDQVLRWATRGHQLKILAEVTFEFDSLTAILYGE